MRRLVHRIHTRALTYGSVLPLAISLIFIVFASRWKVSTLSQTRESHLKQSYWNQDLQELTNSKFNGFIWSERIRRSSDYRQHDRPIQIQTRNSNGSPNSTRGIALIGAKEKRPPEQQAKYREIRVAALHVDEAEFPLSRILYELTLRLALDSVNKRLEMHQVKLSLSIRSANTCSGQYAAAIAAEEFFVARSRLFIVSGCDDAIRGVSRLASVWRVPVMTAAGFGADLDDKGVYTTLVRVAFSLQTAVEFLIKILESFKWRRVNLIVDESDTNSLALKNSIERHLIDSSHEGFKTTLNTISLDLVSLSGQSTMVNKNEIKGAPNNYNNYYYPNSTIENSFSSKKTPPIDSQKSLAHDPDRWPNDYMNISVRDVLKQSAMFSRVTILLIPQQYVRKFMLSVSDNRMANGLYTFLTMPLLMSEPDSAPDGTGSRPPVGSSTKLVAMSNRTGSSRDSYSLSAGENVFIWRSSNSLRNNEAKRAFESLMSIYLKIPTTKQFLYFTNRLTQMANNEFATSTSNTLESSNGGGVLSSNISTSEKIQLNVNPYTASFYDCLHIYSTVVIETLTEKAEPSRNLTTDSKAVTKRVGLHERVAGRMRKRRFEDMVTGTIFLNENGDREPDYTLDDMNQMTGKFVPVILFTGTTRKMQRQARIEWSSDPLVGETIDSVECHLSGTCESKGVPRFVWTLLIVFIPLFIGLGLILYFVFNHLNMEAQLVDHWWKLSSSDIEIISTRRRDGEGSTIVQSVTGGSQPSSHAKGPISRKQTTDQHSERDSALVTKPISEQAPTTITKVTCASANDYCYGNISLALYKLNKIALKPIIKFHQSRQLMIELRTMKAINHANLCRFVGILVEEGNTAIASEFCTKGSLREFFQNESMVIDWVFKYSIINDIMSGLTYLHSTPLEFHGRLKSCNCLVNSRFVIKLSDYGLGSLYTKIDEAEEENVLLAKKLWLAPELLKVASKGGSKKGDVYAFGLLLCEIMTSKRPFYDEEKKDYALPLKSLIEQIKTNGPAASLLIDFTSISGQDDSVDSLINLARACLSFDPTSRPSLAELNHKLKRITRGITSKKLLENLTNRMEQYTNNLESLVDAKLATLVEEKQKTEDLLYQFVPISIASRLKAGDAVEPEAYDCVTVFYSDIVGFTSLSSESTPIQVIDFLSDIYLCFDECLEQYDIFKMDTVGDAYIVVSGLPQRNEGKHVIEIACAAFDLRDRVARFEIAHKPDRRLQMRVGIHSGPCIAGIVGGISMPKYCVFGDTLTIGHYMEQSGMPMKIQITEESKNLLDEIGHNFTTEPRVPKVVKDGIPMQTYWLERANEAAPIESGGDKKQPISMNRAEPAEVTK